MITNFSILRLALISFLVFTSVTSSGASAAKSDIESAFPGASRVADRLRKAFEASGFKNGDIGLWVGTTGADGQLKTVFGQNADKLYIPASLSKIATAGAVMSRLPPGFKFKTQLLHDPSTAKLSAGVLTGPLYLKGGGDPSFVSENMWFLVNELTRAGITRIDGDVIVDDSRFDHIRFGDDRQDERVDRAYDAPVGGMSMNWNSVNVYVRAGEKAGDPAKVFADVQSPFLKVVNNTKTAAAGRGKTIAVERKSESGFDGDVIVVNGAIALDLPELVIYKSISQPDKWAGYNLIEFLKQRGITVKGTVKTGETPARAIVLATSESRAIAASLADMLKWSNNFVAETLVKTLAAENGEKPATMAGGMALVQKYLESVGLKAGEYEFINAAGFTRKNKLSVTQLGRILEHIRGDFTTFPEYSSGMPIAGVDGTLRSRMKGGSAERWVRAKTGLLNGVVGLAGFAGRPNGSLATFAFIYNGGGREDKARALFDRMAGLIVEE